MKICVKAEYANKANENNPGAIVPNNAIHGDIRDYKKIMLNKNFFKASVFFSVVGRSVGV